MLISVWGPPITVWFLTVFVNVKQKLYSNSLIKWMPKQTEHENLACTQQIFNIKMYIFKYLFFLTSVNNFFRAYEVKIANIDHNVAQDN